MIHGTDKGNKDRKDYLARKGLISCALCPYHKSENARRRQRPNKYKNILRDTIRRMDEPQSIEVEDEG